MRQSPRRLLALSTCLWLLGTAAAAEATTLLRPLGIADPMPMRAEDALERRDFHYNDVSLMNRISFQPLRPLASGLAEDREGLYGFGGSTRSKELYAVFNLQATMPLDNDWLIRYRFQRNEDFDGRYDRNLIGFGRQIGPHWALTLSGDFVGDKSQQDLELEASWRDGSGSYLRMALVAPDFMYNTKQGEAEYADQPFTAFADLRWQLDPATALQLFINHNTPLRLMSKTHDLEFRYRQDFAGVGLYRQLGEAVWFHAWIEGERSQRYYASSNEPPPVTALKRRFTEMGGEFVYQLNERWVPRIGLRRMYLNEIAHQGETANLEHSLRREEHLLHLGVSRQMGSRHSLHPVVYLNHLDNLGWNAASEEYRRGERSFVGKVALPWQWRLNQASGASVVINPTFYLHRWAFGGGNVQLSLPL